MKKMYDSDSRFRGHNPGGRIRFFAIFIPVIILLFTAGSVIKADPAIGGGSKSKPEKLTLGLHFGTASLLLESWSGETSIPDWETNMLRNLRWIAGRGYKNIHLNVMEASEEGHYFFQSPVLEENSYYFWGEVMGIAVPEAHGLGMEIYAETTVMAWALDTDPGDPHTFIGGDPLTIREVQWVTETLLDTYDFDGIVAESYPLNYAEAIARTVHQFTGKKFIHKFDDPRENADIVMSEDYVGFLSSPEHVEKVGATGAEANNLGLFNAMFGHAKVWGRPGWVKVSTDEFDLPRGAAHNVMLLRAVQFGPSGYFWMHEEGDGNRLMRGPDPIMDAGLLSGYLNRWRIPIETKPKINLIIALPFGKDAAADAGEMYTFMVHTLGAATNGPMLSGYDILTTYNKTTDADGYLVLTAGTVDEVSFNAPTEVFDLLEGPKPAVFVVWGIDNSAAWRDALPYFGYSAAPRSFTIFTEPIDEATFTLGTSINRALPWSSPTIWEFPIHTADLSPADFEDGTVLATGKRFGRKLVLAAGKGNKYLINASVLHLQTTFIFNQLFKNEETGSGLIEPFFGYGTIGKRSAFLALTDTPLAANLPFADGARLRLTTFNRLGRLNGDERIIYTKPLNTTLKEHQLLIVEPDSSPLSGSGDFNGDGTDAIAIFRPTSGLWAIRGFTRAYYGSSGDSPVPGDYSGDGTADIALFRPSSGLWAVRGVTRVYFGSSSDFIVPGDYDGDGDRDPGIFRPTTGLWAIRSVTRAYFGTNGDAPVSGDYDGDGTSDIALFRETAGLWAVRGVTRIYFGGTGDIPTAGDYTGDGNREIGLFRPAAGLWAVRGVTRTYFGQRSDQTVTADYDGDGIDDIGIFRAMTGLWGIRGVTRTYFGTTGDVAIIR